PIRLELIEIWFQFPEFMKVAAFGVHAVNFLMLLQRLSPAIIRFLIQEVWSWFQDVAVQSSGIVTTSRYVVPTGRVKVPAGRYVVPTGRVKVPTGKDNVIVSAGRAKVIPAGRTILVLEVIILISLASLRLEDLSRAGPTLSRKVRMWLLVHFCSITAMLSILFDSSSDRSFVDSRFSTMLNIDPVKIGASYEVELADGRVVSTNTVLKGCTSNLVNHIVEIDLMPIELGTFDVIVSMDWPVKHDAIIVCGEKVVRIPYKPFAI
ncbi:reverse transcriptase domain-containing protein, partial [Tanacetum coccineum]